LYGTNAKTSNRVTRIAKVSVSFSHEFCPFRNSGFFSFCFRGVEAQMADRKRRHSGESSASLHEESDSDDGNIDVSRYDLTTEVAGAADDDEPAVLAPAPQRIKLTTGKDCPYMDTINRNVLDFDRARECSVTGALQNVYGCLICGKYFQGRGIQTQAYLHSVSVDHHMFINLNTEKVHSLLGSDRV
jgi:U4/U6.U5 tri-snRNP-associated protein 2